MSLKTFLRSLFSFWQSPSTSYAESGHSQTSAHPSIPIPMNWTSIIDLQKELKARGYYQGNIDGQFGPLTLNALAQLNKKAGTFPKWMSIAMQELGVSEILGPRNNARILEYHKHTTLKAVADAVAWCSAFVCWVMDWAGISSTNSAAARSWIKWGQGIPLPVFGCVVVFQRGASPSAGHVAFYLCTIGDRIWVLGGNQGDKVSIAPFKPSDVLAYRMPKITGV